MTALEAENAEQSISLQCPGGRLGLRRFQAILEMIRDFDEVTLMVSRRQALAVQGPIDGIPSYLFRQLQAEDISGPNVKSYPYRPSGTVQSYVIDALKELSDQSPAVTFAYSAGSDYRANMRLEDFSVHRSGPTQFKLETNLWKNEPKTLLPSIDPQNLPLLFEALSELLTKYSSCKELRQLSFRTLRKTMLRIYNKRDVPPESRFDPDDQERLESTLSEQQFTGEASTFDPIVNHDRTRWMLVPVDAGIISDDLRNDLLNFLVDLDVQSFRLTPEQNILIPLPDERRKFFPDNKLADHYRSYDGDYYLPRILTCPGSTFCSNVKTNPVKLSRRIVEELGPSENFRTFNHQYPIGITGCGETRTMEQYHPIGLYPAGPERFNVSIGGCLHQEGRIGEVIPDSYAPGEVPRAIETIVEAYFQSNTSDFTEWCKSASLAALTV